MERVPGKVAETYVVLAVEVVILAVEFSVLEFLLFQFYSRT